MANVAAFMDAVGSSKGNRAIRVNTNNGKGAEPSGVEFRLCCQVSSINTVIHSKIMRASTLVGAKEALVDLQLTSVPKRKEIGVE